MSIDPTIAVTGVASTIGGYLAPYLTVAAVHAFGFGSGGVVAGSTAAAMMSSAGPVVAGSTVAVLQSIGAVGALGAAAVAISSLGGATVAGGAVYVGLKLLSLS
eukprot:TRINITY_DN252_c0_g1_i1.p1 TRINITY_DN252_c0_g1~~TRINITY_DN252_c0_g1_i1.p1  ORF type:complete len:104 (+),score=32.47 TRINITY_DN252_c0_g1_i1:68-379(+)